MKAKITITLKPGLLDAQGKTIHGALASLGFRGVTSVRMGKYLEIGLNHHAAGKAKRDVERMCQKLLANPVVEQYRIEVESSADRGQKSADRRQGGQGAEKVFLNSAL